jgi:iron-sulfur cluster repair protein YtfE (RIC family)
MSLNAGSILETDHAHLDTLLRDAINAFDVDAEHTYRSLDLFWARLAMHIRAEHVVVFPALREADANGQLAHGDIPNILDELRHDHDFFMTELARAIKALRLVFSFGNEEETIVVVRGIVEQVQSRLKQHNRVEEEMIYPMISSLGPPTAEIAAKVLKQLENLPQRFHSDNKPK